MLLSKGVTHCCTAFACTATRTATPTNFSDKTEHATNRTWIFPAQNGYGRSPANNVRRVPPSALLVFLRPPMPSPNSKGPSDVYRNPLESAVINQLEHTLAITSSSLYEPLGIISSKTPIFPSIFSAILKEKGSYGEVC